MQISGWLCIGPYRDLWKDLWELGHQKQSTVHHVTSHAPLASPGNNEADTLAKVHWLEMVPTSP